MKKEDLYQNFSLYNGQVELKFNPEKHVYMVKGERVEGATGVTGIINKPALIYWAVNQAIEFLETALKAGQSYDEIQLKAILEGAKKAHRKKTTEAGDIGTLVHEAIETYIKTGEKTKLVHEKAKNCFEAFLGWAKDKNVKFLESERKVYSKNHKYAGTMDFRCEIDGKFYIGDTKTSSGIFDEFWFQVSAYQQAYEEETGTTHDGQIIVRVGKDGSFEVQTRGPQDYVEDVAAFNGALALYKRIQKLNDIKKLNGEK